MNLTSIQEDPGLAQGVKDPSLLWLWHRPAATALIPPLAWEPPYAMDVALKRQEKKKNNTKQQQQQKLTYWEEKGRCY